MAVADSVQTLNARILELGNASGTLKTAQANADSFFGSLKTAAVAAVAYLGAVQITSFAAKAAAAYNEQNKASRGLGEAQVRLAADMQVALGVSDNLTMGLMKQASILGVAEQDLRAVSMAAMGLSEATGVGLNEALKKVNAAINGNAGALQDYLPELRNMATEEEKLAAVTALAQAGLQKKATSMQHLDGVMKSASNATSDLWEKIGTLLEPALRLTYSAIATFAEVATSALIPAVTAMGGATEWWANATQQATEYVVAAITAVEVVFNNLGTIVDIAGSTAYLALLKFSLDVQHLLTQAIPAYIAWFAENWISVFQDMGSAVITIFQNIGSNIGEAAFALFDWIASGFSGGFEGLNERLGNAIFVGMLDGFEAKAKALPEVLARAITDDEAMLAASIGAMGTNLGNQFSTKFEERMATLKVGRPDFDMDFDLATAGIGKAGAGKDGQLKATESRLLTRGRSDDPNAKIADNTKATVDQLKIMNAKPAPQPNIKVELVRA